MDLVQYADQALTVFVLAAAGIMLRFILNEITLKLKELDMKSAKYAADQAESNITHSMVIANLQQMIIDHDMRVLGLATEPDNETIERRVQPAKLSYDRWTKNQTELLERLKEL
jgi:hypothetical protein|tara:strand:+ start:22 stop:363 length:342 start_codon:yes stop_codon:yes gene_type:complete